MSQASISPTATSSTLTRYGMVFDMDACVGCQTCTIACKQTNQTTPGIMWRNVLDLEVGTFPDVERSFLLTGCQHCEQPPCVPVCPTGATWKRDDGLVVIDYDVCIGCSSCVVACPYQARTLDKDPPDYYGGAPMPTEHLPRQEQRTGVAQKCTFCKERVDDGLARGLVPGLDPDATPACANACISQAITFGNLADPQDRAARMLAEAGGRQMHDELGTNPQIFYLGERRANAAKPGPVQQSWDFRAAMNFIAGGAASGLMVVASLAYLLAGLPPAALRALHLGGGMLMALGLLFVFMKLGRKLRFWRVLARWQTSWMTRETYCVAMIFAGLAGSLVSDATWLAAVIGVGGAGFLYCQAKILHTSRGIPVWRSDRMPVLLTATGILEGSGLLLLQSVASGQATVIAFAAATGTIAAIVLALTWRAYANEESAASAGALVRFSARLNHIGHWAPAACLAFVAMAPGTSLSLWIGVLAAIICVGQGTFWKYMVIVRCSRFQGTMIPDPSRVRHLATPAVTLR